MHYSQLLAASWPQVNPEETYTDERPDNQYLIGEQEVFTYHFVRPKHLYKCLTSATIAVAHKTLRTL